MTWDIIFGCVTIIIARVGDVSLGTMRTVAVVSGHRGVAWLLGLLEMTIWVFVVSAVIEHIRTEPAYGIAFAFGAATGNYIGVTLQGWLPFGSQVVRVFTRDGAMLFERLHREGFAVTRFQGEGRDGAVAMLFVQVSRARTRHVLRAAREVDPRCYYTIDDIRTASAASHTPSSTGPSS
ncbi:MAG: DUF2179 domain-containing protein [Phycisphaerae bacterium]|nr:DUF2179 domain-containing protein [Phycisphaerae bacterium]